MTALRNPGLSYEVVRDRSLRSPLRSDIAGFIGRTHRGPINRLERVVGWREYENVFGGLDEEAPLSYVIRGYFENGGQIAHVHRVPNVNNERAEAKWTFPDVELADETLPNAHQTIAKFIAASPGQWADGLVIKVDFSRTKNDLLRLNFFVKTKHGESERFRAVTPVDGNACNTIKRSIESVSRLIRLDGTDDATSDWGIIPKDLPRFSWQPIVLKIPPKEDPPKTGPPTVSKIFADYSECMAALMDEPEIALISFPTLEDECRSAPNFATQFKPSYTTFLETSLELASHSQDRMIVASVPQDPSIDLTKDIGEFPERRCVAFYRPRVQVRVQRSDQLLTLDPSGHVAGVMARVDRERGAHFTPANVLLRDAVGLDGFQRETNEGDPHDYSNQIRCVPGRGLLIWGGRTLDESSDGRFVAHRRFIHRIVRAIRRAAEPIVFDANGPEMWRVLARTVTTLLLEAFRGGALLGQTPEEAFYVKCNEETNPYTEREQGRVMCEIGVALAAPMEFITFRVSVSQEGEVEVFES